MQKQENATRTIASAAQEIRQAVLSAYSEKESARLMLHFKHRLEEQAPGGEVPTAVTILIRGQDGGAMQLALVYLDAAGFGSLSLEELLAEVLYWRRWTNDHEQAE